MILAVDVGNTNIVFGGFDNNGGASSRVMLAINDKYRPDEAVFLPPQGLLAVAMAKPSNVEGTAPVSYTHLDVYKRQRKKRN